MCRIPEEYRRLICNDLHVLFDPYEWDYSVQPKELERFKHFGQGMSRNIEHKGIPCSDCDLLNICGGVNRQFHDITNGTMVTPVADFYGDKNNFYWYRKRNVRTLQERV